MLILAVCCLIGSATGVAAELQKDWNQWRGPQRTCEFEGPEWPATLSEEQLKKVWEVKLAPSYSGPVVNGSAVFVTETENQESEVVKALDRQTGEELWQTKWKGAMKVPFFAAANGSWIRATPALDENRLYVAGMRDFLVCLNTDNGEVIWKVDFTKKFASELPKFGFVSSPLVYGEFVYVQAGGGMVKLNKMDGEVVWRKLVDGGGMSGSAFSSPTVSEINEQPELLVQTRQELVGLDLENGETFWKEKIPAFRGMNILTPTCFDNAVFTSSYGGGSVLLGINQEADKKVEERWKNKIEAYMSSPVLIDGYLYLHLRNQRFSCIDWKTGEEMWRTKPYGKYWSMIYQGKRLLALDERGDLMLINATPEKFDLVEKIHLTDDPAWAHLAMSANEIFVRTLNSQIVYRWE